MFKIKFVFVIILGFLALYSCDNKVDINSEYSDIPIVYGLLDQTDSRHFIKLSKAFLIDGNVYVGALDPTLSQYDPSDIEMSLDEYNNSSRIRTIQLDTVLITNKDSGVFYSPNQIVWATPFNTVLNSNYSYELYIKIKSLDKVLKATTNLVKDFGIAKPQAGQRFVSFTGTLPQTVEWRSAINGKLYQLTIRFFYTEKNIQNVSSVHYVDMPLSLKRSNTTAGNEKMTEEFYGESFYKNLLAKVKNPEQGMVRYPDSVHYILSVADETFTVYMDVNKPATGVATERPAYTNIENGLGVFAGRYNKVRSFEGLATQSIDSLIHGQYTYKLGFANYPIP